jgi:murein DD-endopeptidase MepM/ murein hydrolase activator NlpD
MPQRVVLLLTLALVIAVPASLSGPADASRLSDLQTKIAAAEAQEAALSSQVVEIEGRIRDLERQVGGVSTRLDTLERDLALQQEKLDRIQRLFRFQSEQLNFLQAQYSLSLTRLNRRLIEVYESDETSTLEVLLSTHSLSHFLDQVDYVRDLGAQDSRISTQVSGAKTRMRSARAKTKVTRDKVATVTRTIAVRTNQVRAVRERLLISKKGLSASRAHKREQIASIEQTKREYLHEAAGLQASSSQVLSTIQSAGSSSYDSTPSASGLIWPVNGPVVSGFGMRWGRLHAGIDIAVGYGTPIHASASGRVIFAGWMGGYGNFVIIDHGGGISTGYAHQSSIAVGGGTVSQGQVIGYVGCTGHCFGPHLHFEVRINGTPVDPLGYL